MVHPSIFFAYKGPFVQLGRTVLDLGLQCLRAFLVDKARIHRLKAETPRHLVAVDDKPHQDQSIIGVPLFRLGQRHKALRIQLRKAAFVTQGYPAVHHSRVAAQIEFGIIQLSVGSDLYHLSGVPLWRLCVRGIFLATDQRQRRQKQKEGFHTRSLIDAAINQDPMAAARSLTIP